MKGYVKAVILIIFGLALLLPFASTFPDGLETVAETFGIEEHEPLWQGPMPDYSLPFVDNPYASTFLSGVLGILLVLVVAFIVGKAVAKSSGFANRVLPPEQQK